MIIINKIPGFWCYSLNVLELHSSFSYSFIMAGDVNILKPIRMENLNSFINYVETTNTNMKCKQLFSGNLPRLTELSS